MKSNPIAVARNRTCSLAEATIGAIAPSQPVLNPTGNHSLTTLEQKPHPDCREHVLPALDPLVTERVNSRNIRTIILDQSFRANVGHIGSALSVADIMAALYSCAILHAIIWMVPGMR